MAYREVRVDCKNVVGIDLSSEHGFDTGSETSYQRRALQVLRSFQDTVTAVELFFLRHVEVDNRSSTGAGVDPAQDAFDCLWALTADDDIGIGLGMIAVVNNMIRLCGETITEGCNCFGGEGIEESLLLAGFVSMDHSDLRAIQESCTSQHDESRRGSVDGLTS